MATDSPPSQGGRRHFHRGRRGQERRGGERRGPSQQQPQRQAAEQGSRGEVDVEQIMRDIRSKIAQRHGVELTDQQVQELAARRLESILDPRTIKPSLLDQLRRAAGARPDSGAAAARVEPPYTFEDTTLYESPNAFIRFFRKLLAPILKLFFNPNPLIRALNIQAKLNAESLKREAERDERQAQWNALHYELLQRVVGETAKVSLEVQNLALRVESLAAKVDFNERRVRGIEGTVHQGRPAGARERERERDREVLPQQEPSRREQLPPAPQVTEPVVAAPEAAATTDVVQGEAPRRRRRRRRGRRGAGAAEAMAPGGVEPAIAPEALESDEGDEEAETEIAGPAADLTDSDVVAPTDDFPSPTPELAGPTTDLAGEDVRSDAIADVAPASPSEPAAETRAPIAEAVTTEGEAVLQQRAPAEEAEQSQQTVAPEAEQTEDSLAEKRERVLEPHATRDDPDRGPSGQ